MLVCSPPEILCPRIHCLMIVVIALDNHPHLIYSENTPAMTSIDPSRMPWIASAFLPACTRPQSLRVAGDQTKLKASTAYVYVHCNGLDVLQGNTCMFAGRGFHEEPSCAYVYCVTFLLVATGSNSDKLHMHRFIIVPCCSLRQKTCTIRHTFIVLSRCSLY